MVEFSCGEYSAEWLGIVDSGADGSLLPVDLAIGLGLDREKDLVASPKNSGAAGGLSFPTWTTANAISGRIVGYLPSRTLWGPKIAFRPMFAEQDFALFGRSDFFQSFTITFETNAELGPVFHLDY